ncbi:hypothetical protein FB471_1622 [Amycolatopsis cihanbeyliensis]|uniref:DUF1365 family protein n=1 Tax=Amycolatopsis cihanbeyliensis TaxID=1128664 RepID=A0A542DFR3_AMYCI|nr:hypothetical protein FB471_1622 [Amycolatopsis cihanbeyliensis]
MTVPCVYETTVGHVRAVDPPSTFASRMYLWLVDLDDLPRLPLPLRPLASFDPRDHFAAEDPRGIREKLDAWLATRGVDLCGGRVLMLGQARTFGYTFNPITLYWCHLPGGEPHCVVAEVHNTYGGRHAYLLWPDSTDSAEVGKEFAVSPFLGPDLEYRTHLPRPDSLLSTTVRVCHERGAALTVTVRGVRRAPHARFLMRTLLSRPLEPLRVAWLIRWHGFGLLRRGAPRFHPGEPLGELNA